MTDQKLIEAAQRVKRKAIDLGAAIEEARRLGLAVNLEVVHITAFTPKTTFTSELLANCVEVRPHVTKTY